MVLAANLDTPCVVFESDNIVLVQVCINEIQRGELGAISQDINFLKNSCKSGVYLVSAGRE